MPDEEPPKNPFIRWKQHVDSHISAALQEVTGLPSAVTRNLNLRWPEVEEERRKELERQKELQRKRLEEGCDYMKAKKEAEVSPASPSTASPSSSPPDTDPKPTGVFTFFSGPRSHCPRANPSGTSPPSPDPSGSGAPGASGTPDTPGSPHSWTSWPDLVQMARWHAFAASSPYSPLNLRNLPQPRPCDLPANADSPFTFEDAFEDLLTMSCGRDLPTIQERAEMRRVLNHIFPNGEPAFYWVRRLQSQDLLNGLFPRAEQVRKELERQREDEDLANKQDQDEAREKRGRMWKWAWNRQYPAAGEKDQKKTRDDLKSFEEWDADDWLKEIDSIIGDAAKDARKEWNNATGIFQELDRVFKEIKQVGEDISGVSSETKKQVERNNREDVHEQPESKSQPGPSPEPQPQAQFPVQPQTQLPPKAKQQAEEETEEDVFSAIAKTSANSQSSLKTMTNMVAEEPKETELVRQDKLPVPFKNTTTEDSTDGSTGVRTIKTVEESMDESGNRATRTEVRQLDSEGEEISRQTSYSNSLSASWSWSSSPKALSQQQQQQQDGGDEAKASVSGGGSEKKPEDKTGWFWK